MARVTSVLSESGAAGKPAAEYYSMLSYFSSSRLSVVEVEDLPSLSDPSLVETSEVEELPLSAGSSFVECISVVEVEGEGWSGEGGVELETSLGTTVSTDLPHPASLWQCRHGCLWSTVARVTSEKSFFAPWSLVENHRLILG